MYRLLQIEEIIKKDNLIAMNKQKADEWRLSIGGHFSEATAPINLDCTIAYSAKGVKRVIFAKRDRNGKIN